MAAEAGAWGLLEVPPFQIGTAGRSGSGETYHEQEVLVGGKADAGADESEHVRGNDHVDGRASRDRAEDASVVWRSAMRIEMRIITGITRRRRHARRPGHVLWMTRRRVLHGGGRTRRGRHYQRGAWNVQESTGPIGDGDWIRLTVVVRRVELGALLGSLSQRSLTLLELPWTGCLVGHEVPQGQARAGWRL